MAMSSFPPIQLFSWQQGHPHGMSLRFIVTATGETTRNNQTTAGLLLSILSIETSASEISSWHLPVSFLSTTLESH
jgi:hypothetical protein